MSGLFAPLSARRAANLLVGCGSGCAPENWRAEGTEAAPAGEMERLELVLGIAERMQELHRTAGTDPAEMDICRRLLRHLSEPCRTAVAGRRASCLQ